MGPSCPSPAADLSSTMNVSLSASCCHEHCIWYSSSSVNGSDAVCACSSASCTTLLQGSRCMSVARKPLHESLHESAAWAILLAVFSGTGVPGNTVSLHQAMPPASLQGQRSSAREPRKMVTGSREEISPASTHDTEGHAPCNTAPASPSRPPPAPTHWCASLQFCVLMAPNTSCSYIIACPILKQGFESHQVVDDVHGVDTAWL
jgi:hypothetical protein